MSRYYRRRRSKDSDLFASFLLLIVIGSGLTYKFSTQDVATTAILSAVLFLLIGVAGAFALLLITKHRRSQMRALSAADVDRMDPFRFEQYVGELLRSQGYTGIQVTQATGDYGVDVTAIKDSQKWAVQAKRYHGRVGIEAVQQAYAGCNYYKCQRSMVVTTSFFTNAAKALALANSTALVDRHQLAEWIIAFQQAGQHG